MSNSIVLGKLVAKRPASPVTTHILLGLSFLFLLTIAVVIAGKWYIKSTARTQYSADTAIYRITIGSDVVAAPANTIRFRQARADGAAERLDLFFHWPEMTGYTAATHKDFNHVDGSRRILFVTFEARAMADDMSGRFEPIYRSLLDGEGTHAPGGLTLYDFKPDSGYDGEILAVAQAGDRQVFVARCLTGAEAEKSLAPCERDIHVGNDLSLNYRFPRQLLQGWRSLDAAILARAGKLVTTTPHF